VDEAKAVMDYPYRHMLEVDNRRLVLEYARRDQRPPHPADSSAMPKPSNMDWVCANDHCGTVNFARRQLCFTCQLPRRDSAPLVQQQSSASASATLVVNGLEPHVAESHLLYVLQMLAVVKELRMPKERGASGGCNRGFAFVDLHSVEDAARVGGWLVASFAPVPLPSLVRV